MVSPDHILNESALRYEGPLSTVVLLALSKPNQAVVMYLALSHATMCAWLLRVCIQLHVHVV